MNTEKWTITTEAVEVLKRCVEFCLDDGGDNLEGLHSPQAIREACALLGIQYETPVEFLRAQRHSMPGCWVYPGGWKIWVDADDGTFQCQSAYGAVNGTTPAASLAEAEEMLAEAIR